MGVSGIGEEEEEEEEEGLDLCHSQVGVEVGKSLNNPKDLQ